MREGKFVKTMIGNTDDGLTKTKRVTGPDGQDSDDEYSSEQDEEVMQLKKNRHQDNGVCLYKTYEDSPPCI